jgi:hypothetical protein
MRESERVASRRMEGVAATEQALKEASAALAKRSGGAARAGAEPERSGAGGDSEHERERREWDAEEEGAERGKGEAASK